MTNQECIIAILASHREARGWTDEAVALDLIAQLGLDADGEAKHAAPPVDPTLITEDEVLAAETAAQEAADKAKAARATLAGQTAAEATAKADAAADQAKAATQKVAETHPTAGRAAHPTATAAPGRRG